MSEGPADDALRMAIVDKVHRLEELQAHEIEARRRTARTAWLLVLLAGVVLAAIVAGFGWKIAEKRDELATLRGQANTETERLATLEASVATLEAREQELNRRIQGLTGALSQLPKDVVEAAVTTSVDGRAPPAQWVSRAYLHIVEAEDRAWAAQVASRLRGEGMIVPGIELVAAARGLKRTDVRYYRKADEKTARAIVEHLGAMGIPAVPNYLSRFEDSDRVSANNFEIWFVAGSRELPLR